MKLCKWSHHLKTITIPKECKGKKIVFVPQHWFLEDREDYELDFVMLETNEPIIVDLSEVSL